MHELWWIKKKPIYVPNQIFEKNITSFFFYQEKKPFIIVLFIILYTPSIPNYKEKK
jgi:hypothetical protein